MKNTNVAPTLKENASGFFMPFPSLDALAGVRRDYPRAPLGKELNEVEPTRIMGGGSTSSLLSMTNHSPTFFWRRVHIGARTFTVLHSGAI